MLNHFVLIRNTAKGNNNQFINILDLCGKNPVIDFTQKKERKIRILTEKYLNAMDDLS